MRWRTNRKLTHKMTAEEAEQSLIRLGCVPVPGTEDKHGMPAYCIPGDTKQERWAWCERKIRQYGLFLE